MKRIILRTIAIIIAMLLMIGATASCSRNGKTLLTLEKDGITVTLSANIYELMLSRTKGTLLSSGLTANGLTADNLAFWDYQDKFDGENLQTIDRYYSDLTLGDCKVYLAALYLFEREGLTLSASAEEEIETRLQELIRTDGDGSKTKLNTVLSAYGVNYNILKDVYTMEAKMEAVKTHLYGENASKVGPNVKAEFMKDNYVHFRQIFLPAWNYVYETDDNNDIIYYYEDGINKDHIYYDKHNGEASDTVDENGDIIYFEKNTDRTKIAYDKINGKPRHVLNEDGSAYKTEAKSEEELSELEKTAEGLYESLKNSTDAEFEKAIAEKDENTATASTYDDGYYLQKNIDYLASGESNKYLADIIEALEDKEDGTVALIESLQGFLIVKKYPHTEKAYELEQNQTWFQYFNSGLIQKLFLDECQALFADITVGEKVMSTVPSMKEVGINYYY